MKLPTQGPSDRKKILFIERVEHSFTPLAIIPAKYTQWILPYAGAYYQGDQDWDLLSQVFRLKDMNIWGHHIFAHNNFMLAPFTPHHIIALHFMHADSIVADIQDSGLFNLNQKQANLFSLHAKFHKARLIAGQHIFSFHINVTMETLAKLSNEFPILKLLAGKEVGPQSGALNLAPYDINPASRRLIMEIIGCRYVEIQAEFFLRRCCIALFCNFARQDQQASTTPPEDADIKKLQEAFDYLALNFTAALPIAEIASMLDMTTTYFIQGFQQIFCIAPEEFIMQEKMIAAYHLLLQTKSRISTIAIKTGFKDRSEFEVMFESYFNCTPQFIRNAQ